MVDEVKTLREQMGDYDSGGCTELESDIKIRLHTPWRDEQADSGR